jgi:hypothetical protein
MVASLVALALPGAAGAAGWLAPTTVLTPGFQYSAPQIGTSPQGEVIVVANRNAGSAPSRR